VRPVCLPQSGEWVSSMNDIKRVSAPDGRECRTFIPVGWAPGVFLGQLQ
jgi:hypothetical protein